MSVSLLEGLNLNTSFVFREPAPVAPIDVFPLAVPSREKITELQEMMLSMGEGLELPVRHHFAPGVYCRELTIPAGVVAVGKIHRTEHLTIISSGKVTIWTEEGMKTLEAPCLLHSFPGAKRAAYAHTDVVITTIHPTNETDLAKLEAELIEPEPKAEALRQQFAHIEQEDLP